MSPTVLPPSGDKHDEIPGLIETLLATEARLEQLTAGQVDTVAGQDGRTFLLRRAQEQMRRGEAGKQASILNALPARIALLDTVGNILSVNEAWRNFVGAHVLQGPGYTVSLNYLTACDGAHGYGAREAHEVARGIRSVLAGTEALFSIEYSYAVSEEQYCFLLTATPLAEGHRRGAIVTQLDITDRTRAEEALRQKDALIHMAGRITRTGGWAVEIPSQKVFWSDEIFDLMEFPRGQAPTLAEALELYPIPWREKITAAMIACAEHGAPFDFEMQITTAKKRNIWVRVCAEAKRRKDGSVLRVQGAFQDITERRRADEKLQLLSSAADQSTEAILITDAQLDLPGPQIVFANPAFARMTGYTAAEVIGQTPRIMQGPRTDRALLRHLRENLAAGQMFKGQTINYRKDGQPFPIEWQIAPIRDAQGIVTHYVALQRDITERQLAEMALKRFRALVDQSSDTLEVIDPATGRFLDVNDRGCVMHGFTREEFLDLRITDVSATTTEANWPTVRESIRLHSSRSGEGVHRRKDGTTFPVEFRSKWVKLERDYIVTVVRDITERKATEEQLLHSQRIENIGMLAAGVAHDLNNVLAPMLMAASILQSHITDAGDLRMVQMVEASAQRGAALVRQILGFAHGVGGEQQLVQVKHVLHDIASIITETFPKLLDFEQEIPRDLWTIQGNPTQLHQVILNLCINARDAMPDGGTLTLKGENCSLDEPAARAIPGASPGDWLKLEVSDTGTGIPPDVLAHMWDPFFTTKGPGKGTGLGLSTVRGIVERHRGVITVQTVPARGTTFTVYFPATDGTVGTSPSTPLVFRGNGELIAIVDDEESIRNLITDILFHHGYQVISASDGIDGVGLMAKHVGEIRLVITDFNMPGLNGDKFARVIRSMNPAIKIIGISGGDEGRVAAATANPYADVFLTKPFKAEVLLAQVQELLKLPPIVP
ncbi:MAG: PAS domain S-box protein [Opitutaceae bacterium]